MEDLKDVVLEKLEELREWLDPKKYEYYVGSIQACKNKEELLELASIELQLESVEYISKILDLGYSVREEEDSLTVELLGEKVEEMIELFEAEEEVKRIDTSGMTEEELRVDFEEAGGLSLDEFAELSDEEAAAKYTEMLAGASGAELFNNDDALASVFTSHNS